MVQLALMAGVLSLLGSKAKDLYMKIGTGLDKEMTTNTVGT